MTGVPRYLEPIPTVLSVLKTRRHFALLLYMRSRGATVSYNLSLSLNTGINTTAILVQLIR